MKFLAIDVGNTSTAVGLWSGGRVTKVAHCDGGVAAAMAVAAKLAAAGVDAVAYVSVVPKQDAKWRGWARGRGLKLHQVSFMDFPVGESKSKVEVEERNCLVRVRVESSRVDGGVATPPTTVQPTTNNQQPTTNDLPVIDYPKPKTIGADRLADAAGAVARYGAPVLVMDFGTALTAAVVTRDRVWRGGVIAPGFPLMRDYLFERTAKLPRMEIGRGKVPKIGRSTEEAMRFGALVGYRGMVREIVATLRKNFSEDFRLVATGGFARWALKDLDLPFVIDPTLTLYGCGLVAASKL